MVYSASVSEHCSNNTALFRCMTNEHNRLSDYIDIVHCAATFKMQCRLLFHSSAQIIGSTQRELDFWRGAYEANENVYLPSTGGGRLRCAFCRDVIWICLMCAWNSKCQADGRWVGMCSDAWCLSSSETTK